MIANLRDPLEVGMAAEAPNKPKTDKPYIESAQRIRQLAQILADNPAEAKAFRAMTGVFTAKGKLRARYR
ncbi:hypothetical protein [Pseudomonas sp. CC120222-01a]|uniref:hypothetical protein n=1 Tax=Pseudomonas sp. CC120222-01a TaxID=1378075 RepID=UPI000D9199DC|nr:hypothetical protein [Pseudomonas sp. CC120222-01a]PVZ43206.1 hypothetical protein N430_00895 [Pseudomonas sp. CC120222-01a]